MGYYYSQKYAECQLVALLNALAFLKRPVPKQYSRVYEQLVDLMDARTSDGEIRSEPLFHRLKLQYAYDNCDFRLVKKYIRDRTPVITTVWTERSEYSDQYHSVVIVGFKKYNGEYYVHVPNWRSRKWHPWRQFKKYISDNQLKEFGRLSCRTTRKRIFPIYSY